MSIQETSRKQLKRRLIAKFRLERTLLFPALIWEKLSRAIESDPLKVYFRYKNVNLDLHPWFKRYYTTPPVKYCNLRSAKLFHWITAPSVINKTPFVVEPNDHPLSAVASLSPVPVEPAQVIDSMRRAVELVYHDPSCKKIVVESTGQWELFKRYCPEVLHKCEIIRIGTIPKPIESIDFSHTVTSITFLCLASDFDKKAGDLLLDAWFEFPHRHKHRLILACPFVPEAYRQRAQNGNVTFVLKAPLSKREKDQLYRNSDVAIGPLHVDGGSNLWEAMEYGLPIITMRCQRSKDQVMNDNGFVAEVPFYFYDEGYGIEWPTWSEFFRLLKEAKKRGDFDITKKDFIKAFTFFNDNPEKISEMGKRSYELAANEYSLANRNIQLKRVYQDIHDGKL
ncbi:MAG TPA: hypothetical protein DIT07_12475 [Sphingobacteriaceae bacterium]|nr:hypothetical protein [Sphingobacteriaceae bacterium]